VTGSEAGKTWGIAWSAGDEEIPWATLEATARFCTDSYLVALFTIN